MCPNSGLPSNMAEDTESSGPYLAWHMPCGHLSVRFSRYCLKLQLCEYMPASSVCRAWHCQDAFHAYAGATTQVKWLKSSQSRHAELTQKQAGPTLADQVVLN